MVRNLYKPLANLAWLIALNVAAFVTFNILAQQKSGSRKIMTTCMALAHSMLCHDPDQNVKHGMFGHTHDPSSQGVRPVKSFISTFALAVIAVTTFSSGAFAQDGGIVAVLDVAKVFKVNKDFDSQMKSIKALAEDLKSQIQQRQEAIKSEAMEISQFEAGTPDRNKREADVEQKQAALRTQARQAEADLLNSEAKIYYDTYTKMQRVVGELAAKHGISLVIRFDGADVDPASRPDVIKKVNRTVVYHREIDLTNHVITGMGPRIAEAATNNMK